MLEPKRLADLKVWEDNYNHGDVQGIALSIRRLGFNRAPGIWHDNQIRAGNHTVMALRLIQVEGPRPKLDKAFPPANVEVTETGDWLINWVDLSHLSEDESITFAIADNQWARNAAADPEQLITYLTAMSTDLLAASGFNEDMLKALETAADELDSAIDDLEASAESDPEPIPEQYLVIIDCDDEAQQTGLLERLMGEGLKCRALLS